MKQMKQGEEDLLGLRLTTCSYYIRREDEKEAVGFIRGDKDAKLEKEDFFMRAVRRREGRTQPLSSTIWSGLLTRLGWCWRLVRLLLPRPYVSPMLLIIARLPLDSTGAMFVDKTFFYSSSLSEEARYRANRHFDKNVWIIVFVGISAWLFSETDVGGKLLGITLLVGTSSDTWRKITRCNPP